MTFFWRIVIGFGSFSASVRKARGECLVKDQAPEVLTSAFREVGLKAKNLARHRMESRE
ncbi:hypothetical protein [Endozoicomonas lisbonensis]|uniref:Uncharacterized protein n=1 Tax=Endozoicomonas lisbonensis TaxID=3120522 RepID=A0ABV2SGM3_9GAMM